MNLLGVIEMLREWVEMVRNHRDQDNSRLAAALGCLHHAANLTSSYLSDRRAGVTTTDREREAAISVAWQSVGTALRAIDGESQELYRRCFDKAMYWADPAGWPGNERREASIAIDALRTDVLNYLDPDVNQ